MEDPVVDRPYDGGRNDGMEGLRTLEVEDPGSSRTLVHVSVEAVAFHPRGSPPRCSCCFPGDGVVHNGTFWITT